MIDAGRIRGVLFDYGGTIDSNGVHWGEVIWQAYHAENVPITKRQFREAYVHGERTLGKNPIIKPYHTFLDMMRLKIDIQMEWLKVNHMLISDMIMRNECNCENSKTSPYPLQRGTALTYPPFERAGGGDIKNRIADYCYEYARSSIEKARPVIEWIAGKYPLVMVSNFYGNLHAVLRDFGLAHLFPIIIESAVVGVRKPDPQIFRLGVEALQLQENEVVVIGDSYDKDIIPAKLTGCRTIWLKNTGWSEYAGNETADLIISDFTELQKWM